jgi:FMN reductase
LRPLFGFFSAQTTPTAVYAGDTEIAEGRVADEIVRARVAQAAAELARLLDVAQAAAAPLATAAAR